MGFFTPVVLSLLSPTLLTLFADDNAYGLLLPWCEVVQMMVFLVGQHMLQYQITGQAANPMPERISPWGIDDIFTVADGA